MIGGCVSVQQPSLESWGSQIDDRCTYFYLITIYLIFDAPNHEWFKIIKRIAFLEDGKVQRTITLSAHQRVGGSGDRLAADGNKMKFESRQELWNSDIASTHSGSYGIGCHTMMMIVIISTEWRDLKFHSTPIGLFSRPNIFETDTETFLDQICRDQYRYSQKNEKVSIPRSLQTRYHTLIIRRWNPGRSLYISQISAIKFEMALELKIFWH